MKRKIALGLLLLVLVGGWIALDVVADRVASSLNRVLDRGPYQVSAAAADLHASSLVVDLHADPLLWDRDLLERGDIGQVDLPRLAEGGVGLQVFSVVTKTPKGQNFARNSADSDRITQLAMVQRWPPTTWTSLESRALYQAKKLRRLVRRSGDRMLLIRSRADLDALVQRRQAGEPVVGAMLSLEGAHALEGQVEGVQRLYDAGFRMLGLAHFFDNDVAGSAHGVDQGGLTAVGQQVVSEATRLGMVIDIAHTSPRAVADVLAWTDQPVVASHTGVRGTCANSRNLTDGQLRAIAEGGGVVGIAVFKGATCGSDLAAMGPAIDHAVKVVGIEHVALGLDLDGAITSPIDVSGTPLVTQLLLRRGYREAQIRAILGGNALRVLRQRLPEGSSD